MHTGKLNVGEKYGVCQNLCCEEHLIWFSTWNIRWKNWNLKSMSHSAFDNFAYEMNLLQFWKFIIFWCRTQKNRPRFGKISTRIKRKRIGAPETWRFLAIWQYICENGLANALLEFMEARLYCSSGTSVSCMDGAKRYSTKLVW